MNDENEFAKRLGLNLTEEDWQKIATHADQSVEDTKEQILKAFSELDFSAFESSEVTVDKSEAEVSNGCIKEKIKIGFGKGLSLSLELEACNIGKSNWTVKVKAKIWLFGIVIWKGHYDIDPYNMERCEEIDLKLVKGKFCWAVKQKGGNFCFGLHGEVCIRNFSGKWACKKYNTEICF